MKYKTFLPYKKKAIKIVLSKLNIGNLDYIDLFFRGQHIYRGVPMIASSNNLWFTITEWLIYNSEIIKPLTIKLDFLNLNRIDVWTSTDMKGFIKTMHLYRNNI